METRRDYSAPREQGIPLDSQGKLPIMEVRDVHFAYGKNKVLRGVNLHVEQGKITTILGGNGGGKSTLFNVMTKNLQPDQGKVFLRGSNIAGMGLKEFARQVSIVHQNNSAAADITVEQLIAMGRTPYLKPMSDGSLEDIDIVEWAMRVTDVTSLRNREVSRLSGGQRQRVWIAMALAQNTKVLFLDEPTTYLDIRYQMETLDLVRRLNTEYGITVIMVLHDINQAILYSDSIIGMRDGRVVLQGAPEDVVTEQSIQELFGIDVEVIEVEGKKHVLFAEEDEEGAESADKGNASGEIAASRVSGVGATATAASAAESTAETTVAGRPEPKRSQSKLARILWSVLGVVCFGLGTAGTVLPFLPTVPLYLAALFCFAKGSQRLHDWFVNTSLYHKHLASFVDHRAMTMKTKLTIMGSVTIVMAIAFLLMSSVPVGRVVLAVVWVAHVLFFVFGVKTDKPGEGNVEGGGQQASKKKGSGGMIKTRLLDLLQDSRRYIVYQVAWQWLSLLCQIVIIFMATTLLRMGLQNTLTPLVIGLAMAVFAIALAVRFWADRHATRASHEASVDVKRVIREKIYQKLLRLGAGYRDRVSTAEVVQMAGEGAEQLETYFGKYLSQLFYSVIAPLTLFLVLLPYNWQSALVLLVCVPLIPIVIMAVQKIARRLLNRYWDIYTNLGDSFLENLQGLTTLKIYQMDEAKAKVMDHESEQFRIITMKVLKMQLNSIIVMDLVAYGGAAVGMGVAISQFLAGNIDLAGTMMIVLLSAEFFIPMRLLGSFFHIAMNGMAASDKMFDFLDLEEPEQGSEELPREEGVSIQLEDVEFGYDEKTKVLRSVDLACPAGSFVSLVGTSGCGKSTIANILMGRNKGYAGSIKVNGIELSDLSEESLMKNVTMVTNNSYLFKGTVMDNLLLGNPNASTSDMHRVLEAVNLEGFLRTQQGLNTEIQENGQNLSGGQRQRLAIARALLRDTPCFIFDEATSNIDVESEEVIMEVVRDLARTKTVVLISHRLANVVSSDCVYLLKDGHVAEYGTHDELMAAGADYAHLFTYQQNLEHYGTDVAPDQERRAS